MQQVGLLLLAMALTLGCVPGASASLNCTKFREAFRCLASDRDEAASFRGSARNLHSTEVSVDVMNFVDLCERIKSSPSGPPAPRGEAGMARGLAPPRSSTALTHRIERDLRVPMGGQLALEMEPVKRSGYCSRMVVRNCRTSAGTKMDCASLISIK